MYKTLKIPPVTYEMIVELCKKKRAGMTEYLIEIVEAEYEKIKR